MIKKYVVRLDKSEHEHLDCLVKKGKVAAYKRLNAQILSKIDVSEYGSKWSDKKAAETFNVSTKKVERLRKRLCTKGFEACLIQAKGGGRKRKLDGKQEAHLVTLTCSNPPEGYCRWTLRLLADQMVSLDYVDSISHEAIRQVLKKTKLNHGKKKSGA